MWNKFRHHSSDQRSRLFGLSQDSLSQTVRDAINFLNNHAQISRQKPRAAGMLINARANRNSMMISTTPSVVFVHTPLYARALSVRDQRYLPRAWHTYSVDNGY